MSRKAAFISQNPPAVGDPLLVSVSRAAELLSVSEYTVRNLIRKGELAVKRLSATHWLIPTASIRKFAEGKAA